MLSLILSDRKVILTQLISAATPAQLLWLLHGYYGYCTWLLHGYYGYYGYLMVTIVTMVTMVTMVTTWLL